MLGETEGKTSFYSLLPPRVKKLNTARDDETAQIHHKPGLSLPNLKISENINSYIAANKKVKRINLPQGL